MKYEVESIVLTFPLSQIYNELLNATSFQYLSRSIGVQMYPYKHFWHIAVYDEFQRLTVLTISFVVKVIRPTGEIVVNCQ